jgi:hypothetical protein
MKKHSGVLQQLLSETQHYANMDMIEACVEKGLSLANIPIQPLYLAIRSLPPEQVTQYLPRLSKEQRKIMLDLDLWQKDDVDPAQFEFWIESYSFSQEDQLREEFVSHIDFLLYLKGRLNIWTFDVEDPKYPDHDNYFLTDDSLLLFEFHQDYPYHDHIKRLIRDLYAKLGVEKAYAFLFKGVSESYLSFVEEEYHFKKERLRDAGFVDYYDALEIDNIFPNIELLDHFIKSKKVATGELDIFSQGQILDHKTLQIFDQGMNKVLESWDRVNDEKRSSFLKFNFIRLVNGMISLQGGLREGAVVVQRTGEKVRASVELGHAYAESLLDNSENMLELFDLSELYKIGNSLLLLRQREIKKAARSVEMELDDRFLGQTLEEFLDNTYTHHARWRALNGRLAVDIDSLDLYRDWAQMADTLVDLFPMAKKLKDEFAALREEGRLQDDYYLNYGVEAIDIEAIFLSSLAQFLLDIKNDGPKLGLTLDEFKRFAELNVDKKMIEPFLDKIGLNSVRHSSDYIYRFYLNQMKGYDWEELNDDDYTHVGGPIILKS